MLLCEQQVLTARVVLLLQVPEGDWFCSSGCTVIKAQLGQLVRAGEMALGPVSSTAGMCCAASDTALVG